MDAAKAGRDNAEVRDINAALARMDSGTYGQCGECGEPSPHARVEANPHALHCRACAAASEQAHGAPQHPSL